jgi:hypothetical protein
MKTKIWTRIAFTAMFLGWFPFMWVSIYASWNREIGLIVLLSGFSICLFGGLMMLPVLRNDQLFKSIDELEEARDKYIEATKKLNQKIREL